MKSSQYAKTSRPLSLLIAVGLLCSVAPHAAANEIEDALRFETHILPLFQASCLSCHGEKAQQSGLDLRTRDSASKGGEAGPAIIPGSAGESLLLQKIASGTMPIGGKRLGDEDIEIIRRWINAGALKEGEDEKAGRPSPHSDVAERDVMVTILYLKCVMCHGKRKQDGDLDVRTRASLLKGGKSGPAIIPGKPEESPLIKRLVAEEMHPPERKLLESYLVRPVSSGELEMLRRWIAAGAPADDEVLTVGNGPDPLVSDADRKFWSFQPPQRPALPKVQQKTPARTPLDAFLLEKLEAKGLSFSPEADRLTLIRRAYFDLTGLPPTPEELQRLLAEESSTAYEKMIDALLESPRYGERWGKHWLDAAGYADTEGRSDVNPLRVHAYRYRDYVIRSLNNDKPFDQFLLEQIAGDELVDHKSSGQLSSEQLDLLVATGFLRMGSDGTSVHEAQEVFEERFNVVAEEVEIVSSAVMGLTMACARCHSHKYDPIPLRDYYSFSAIFQAAYDPYDWFDPSIEGRGGEKDPYKQTLRQLSHADERERTEVAAYNAPIQKEIEQLKRAFEEKSQPWRERLVAEKVAALPEAVRQDVRKAIETALPERDDVQKYLVKQFEDSLKVEQAELEERFADFKEEAGKFKKSIQEVEKSLRPEPRIRALFDMGGEPTPVHVLLRGDYRSPGPRVEPGVPSALRNGIRPYEIVKPAGDSSGRRLALARWLVQPNHPLTARVMMNRVWQQHFGTGLVSTPENFGKLGAAPTHPELLDWLATEFVAQGWRLKAMHRQIMTSTAYRQSSRWDADRNGADPDNILLSRFPLRRMDAEELRDSILQVSGRLDNTPFGPPEQVEVESDGEVVSRCASAGCRRSIYMLQPRPKWAGNKAPLTILETFDLQPLAPNCLKRVESTVSSQALQLMNSEAVRESSRYFAGRVTDAAGMDLEKQIERVYLTALSRPPTPDEMQLASAALRDFTRHWLEQLEKETPAEPKESQARWLALATFCHTVLNSPDFIYID